MKFGINLLLWTTNLNEEHLPLLDSLASMGYDGVEIPIFEGDFDREKWSAMARKLDDLNLERTAVTVRNAADNPISPDRAVRERGLENNKRTLDVCRAAGITALVGPYHSAIGHFSGTGPTADEWKWGVETMRATAEYAAEAEVMLCVEALNRFECYLLNCHADAARFAREVDHPNCRVMYDTFHANIEEKNVREAIRSCSDVLAHVHISENDRSTPGQGAIRWDETFDALFEVGYNGYLTIEAFGAAMPDIAAATKIWRKMFDSETQLAHDGLAFVKEQYAKRWPV